MRYDSSPAIHRGFHCDPVPTVGPRFKRPDDLEERLARYAERAALGLPLFNDNDPCGASMAVEPDLLSRSEVAAILGVSRHAVSMLGQRGELTRVKCGYGGVRFRESEVVAFKAVMEASCESPA